jgi:hypothetical protein
MLKSKGNEIVNNPAAPEPQVGIFWFFRDRIIVDSTPLSKAEPYGNALGHTISHIDFWTLQQRKGAVPAEVEYEEPPRGRVVFDRQEKRFHLMADKCILGRRDVVGRLMAAMNLPPGKTTEGRDEHYRCHECLYPVTDDDEDDDDEF